MKKLVILLFICHSASAWAQSLYDLFYSDEYMMSQVVKAKSPIDKMKALGQLGEYRNKQAVSDSILSVMQEIASKEQDKKLTATAKYWHYYLLPDSFTFKESIRFASEHGFPEYVVATWLAAADISMHIDTKRSLQSAFTGDSLVKNWKATGYLKDSMVIETYHRVAHAYLHLNDGVNAARYLMPLKNYEQQSLDSTLRVLAREALMDMYSEWKGHEKASIPAILQLYDHYMRTGLVHKALIMAYNAGAIYAISKDTANAAIYLDRTLQLADSLRVHKVFLYWILSSKLESGMIDVHQYCRELENGIGNRMKLPEMQVKQMKIDAFLKANLPDSALPLLQDFKSSGSHYRFMLMQYHIVKKNYVQALPLLEEMLRYQDYPSGRLEILKNLSIAYKETGAYKLSLEKYHAYIALKDSLDSLNSSSLIAELEMQKQVELQAAALATQDEKQKEEKAHILFRNRIKTVALFGGLVILLIISGILWRNNLRKQRDRARIENAYRELKETQSQLIQQEKMASLGELTAGIAHEIQNPLNFVNNFSEVNAELVDELKSELAIGNTQLATEIADDIKDNSRKINHHGKRADAIVKGMLQHSRTSTGQKEPTDMNALADEYLRLAYHGLRAKDKSFNAKFETDFDKTIEKINVIPQDIARVILNLINNAFYAVDEKKRQLDGSLPTGQAGYEPCVSISTRKVASHVEVRIKDNGSGIQQKVLDKIFQPFFTTKPTGAGTGLGLSLSYDIVKAHGGEIRVETTQDVGSEFAIVLPT